MATFRGLRIATALGVRSLKINNCVQQRKFSALALSSLSQIHRKKVCQFVTESALPVNKFDLSGLSCVTNSPALFSTVSPESVSEETVEASEEDNDSVRSTKWPSPKEGQYQYDGRFRGDKSFGSNQAFFGGKTLNLDEDHLTKLFSKFGEVRGVMIPLKAKYLVDNLTDNYHWGFISFRSAHGLQSAIDAGEIYDGDIRIDVKQKLNSWEKSSEYKRTALVLDLETNVSVKDLLEHFQRFAPVSLINLIHNSYSRLTGKTVSLAFVVFETEEGLIHALKNTHVINSTQYLVRQANSQTRAQPVNRVCRICVENLPEKFQNEDTINEYFSQFAKVKSVFPVKNISNSNIEKAIVEFHQQEDAHNVEQMSHEVDERKLVVKALSWSMAKH